MGTLCYHRLPGLRGHGMISVTFPLTLSGLTNLLGLGKLERRLSHCL